MTDGPFAALGLHHSYCDTVANMGFEEPSDIQRAAIPEVLAHKDILGIAQTGTGKTAAFGLPLLQNLVQEAAQRQGEMRAKPRHPRALILAPTRELALQIHDELSRLTGKSKMNHACVIGGVNQNPQVKKLRAGVDILVAAPGRLLDLMNQGHIDLSETKFLVLDECDRLMDMGFIPDVRRIIKAMPKERQTLLFSATMPTEIAKLSKEILRKPVRIDVTPEEVTVAKIEQKVVHVKTAQKRAALEHLLRDASLVRAIVFTRTKHGANNVTRQLNSSGFVAEVIHGNKSQAARQRALENFKSGDAWILVATDIAARGIDIRSVSHVFNYELPHEPESYVHRIGRTARAGAGGAAWALVDASEVGRLKAVQRFTKQTMERVTLDVDLDAATRQLAPAKPASKEDTQDSKKPAAKRGGSRQGTHRDGENTGKRPNKRRRKPNADNRLEGFHSKGRPEDKSQPAKEGKTENNREVDGNRPDVSNANRDPYAEQRRNNKRRPNNGRNGGNPDPQGGANTGSRGSRGQGNTAARIEGGDRPPKRRRRANT
jgi:ATP-dependent RNA helicase RhlE